MVPISEVTRVLTGSVPSRNLQCRFSGPSPGLQTLAGDTFSFSNSTGRQHFQPRFGAVQAGLSNEAMAAEIDRYCAKTGFPETPKTCALMRAHLKTALEEASHETGVPVLYANFDRYCSLGRGTALPGSDADLLCMLIRGDDADKARLARKLYEKLDPELVNRDSVIPAFMIREDQLQQYLDFPLSKLREQRKPAAEVAVIERMARLMQSMQNGQDPFINHLDDAAMEALKGTPLYRETKTLYDDDILLTAPDKIKYMFRQRLIDQFETLSVPEKYLIVKMLQVRHIEPYFFSQDEGEKSEMMRYLGIKPHEADAMPFLSAKADNPFKPVLESLVQKGLMIYMPDDARYMAPWRPGHVDEMQELEFSGKYDAQNAAFRNQS